jgi:Major Facilitator Superfamily
VSHRRDLRLVAAAALVSATGDLAAVSALAVHVQRETGSGLAVAALFAANWLALAVAAPLGGTLVDRLDARRLLVAASLGQAGIAVLLASTPGTAGVLGLSTLLGAGAAVAAPAEFALVGAIAADGAGVGRANARVETARSSGYLLGPLAGTASLAAAGVGPALLLDAASFVLVALAAVALGVRREPVAETVKPRARDGVVLLTRDRVLRVTMAVLVGSLLAMSASISADVFFADTLGNGAVGLGLLLTAWTAGMTTASLAAAPRVPSRVLAVTAIAAAGVQGAGKLGAAALGLLLPALVFYALGGAGHGIKNVTARTLIHERVPAAAHGRAFAAYAALRNSAELVALAVGGLLVDIVGGRGTLVLAGGAALAIASVGLAALARPYGIGRDSRHVQPPPSSSRAELPEPPGITGASRSTSIAHRLGRGLLLGDEHAAGAHASAAQHLGMDVQLPGEVSVCLVGVRADRDQRLFEALRVAADQPFSEVLAGEVVVVAGSADAGHRRPVRRQQQRKGRL